MPLPPLAFGQGDATITSNLLAASETMAQIVPSMKLAPSVAAKNFRAKVATCAIGDVRLLAHAATACRMEVDESRGWHLIAPYVGKASLRCDGRSFELQSGASALLMPNMQRSTERAPSSVVIASIDIGRLQKTMTVMSGHTESVRFAIRFGCLAPLLSLPGSACPMHWTFAMNEPLPGLIALPCSRAFRLMRWEPISPIR